METLKSIKSFLRFGHSSKWWDTEDQIQRKTQKVAAQEILDSLGQETYFYRQNRDPKRLVQSLSGRTEGKLSRTVRRGEWGCKAPDLPGAFVTEVNMLTTPSREAFERVRDQIGFCGIWCGSCAVGNGCLAGLSTGLRELLTAYGAPDWASIETGWEGFLKDLGTIKQTVKATLQRS